MRQTLPIGLLAVAVFASAPAYANSLTDVGVGAVPDFNPSHGTSWSLSSTCIDINEAGEAACQARADGPRYRCGFHNAQWCSSKVYHVYRWEASGLVLMSNPASDYDVPLAMNSRGDIAGYHYPGAVYPSEGGNGRIWSVPESPKALPYPVVSLNDAGKYILQSATASGGVVQYGGTVHEADGTEIRYPGFGLRPFVIGNGGDVIGGQIVQEYVPETPTHDAIREVSGVGWLLTQAQVDALKRDEDGLIDDDGNRLWPGIYYRPTGFTNYTTTAGDVNDHGDFVFRYNFGGLYSGQYCTPDGESNGLPWKCLGTNYQGGTYAGGKAFSGINNHGDAVGVFTPGVYQYQTSYPTHPWVWLRNAAGKWDEYNANDLLPADSGYTVLSVSDINDRRDIVGTCKTQSEDIRGCILHVTDPAIPGDAIKPLVRIDAPRNGDIVKTKVTVRATALDDWSRIKKVIFKVDATRLQVDSHAPFEAILDPSKFPAGSHTIRATAFDYAGNRRTAKIVVTVADHRRR